MLIRQLFRYAIVGGAVTALQAAIYWLLAGVLGWNPQIGNLLGYGAAVVTGYFAHGLFSFPAGEGRREASPVIRFLRFWLVSLASLALNALWIWIVVTRAGAPVWAPLPLMVVVTPGLVFLLNRQWVFR